MSCNARYGVEKLLVLDAECSAGPCNNADVLGWHLNERLVCSAMLTHADLTVELFYVLHYHIEERIENGMFQDKCRSGLLCGTSKLGHAVEGGCKVDPIHIRKVCLDGCEQRIDVSTLCSKCNLAVDGLVVLLYASISMLLLVPGRVCLRLKALPASRSFAALLCATTVAQPSLLPSVTHDLRALRENAGIGLHLFNV